jgi:hypothetical protein
LTANKETFFKGGYYRIDLSPKLSVLALNTVYYLEKNKGFAEQGKVPMEQLEWLESNLWNSEPDRKFILTCHIYFGVKFEDTLKPLWTNASDFYYRQKFLSIVVRYVDKIIIQINGHDHHADLRYHKGLIPDFLSVSELDAYMKLYSEKTGTPLEEFTFNNMLLNPSVTSLDGTNPGFSLFDFDTKKEVMHNLRMHYLDIRKTLNMTDVGDITKHQELFQEVNYYQDYGVKAMDSKSMLGLTRKLEEGGLDLLLRYITDKAGFNASDP